jgi:DNA-directed RNA polymerase subunit RPC12/RpoP
MSFCTKCGTEIKDETANFCSKCGHKFMDVGGEPVEKEKQVESKDLRSSTLIVERAEPTYYSDNNGVRITPTRLIVPGKNRNEGPSTYAMANITSVKIRKDGSKRWIGILIALAGIVLIIVGLYSETRQEIAIFGAVMLALGILLAMLLKPNYHLEISSASGERDALPRNNKEYIDHVVTAINEALIKRG